MYCTVSLSFVQRLDLANNPVVVILVSVIAAIFIVVAVWARQVDVHDLHHISVVPLCGRDAAFKYEVTVITGRNRGAGKQQHLLMGSE